MAARLSKDTLVQAEDRLRFRHQCIGSWDIRGSTLQMIQETVGTWGWGVQRAGLMLSTTQHLHRLMPLTSCFLDFFIYHFPAAFQPRPRPMLASFHHFP